MQTQERKQKTMSVPVEFVHDFLYVWDGLVGQMATTTDEPFFDWPTTVDGLAEYLGWSFDKCVRHIDRACGRTEGMVENTADPRCKDVISLPTARNICKAKRGFTINLSTLKTLAGPNGRFAHIGEHAVGEDEDDNKFHLVGINRARFLNLLNCRPWAKNATDLFSDDGCSE